MPSPYVYIPAQQPAIEHVVYASRPDHRSSAQPVPIIKHVQQCDCNECYAKRRRSRARSHVRFSTNKAYRDETEEERRIRKDREEHYGDRHQYEPRYNTRHDHDERGRSHEQKAIYPEPRYSAHGHRQDVLRGTQDDYRSSSPAVSPTILDMRDPRWINPTPQAVPMAPAPSQSYSVGQGVAYAQPVSFPQSRVTPQVFPGVPLPGQHIIAAPVSPVAQGFPSNAVPYLPPAQYTGGYVYSHSPDSRRVGKPYGYAAAEYGSDSE